MGVFVYDFVTNFLLSLTVKNFENRSIFGEVMGKSSLSCFFDSQCTYVDSDVISFHIYASWFLPPSCN